jgi:N-glycosylase/DNA lyase
MATNNEETHRILGRIETELGQIKSSVKNLQNDMSEIAGGLAVVLNRSEENKTEVGALKLELDASKKKQTTSKEKFSSLSNISPIDLQRTMLVLQRWRALHQSPKR